MISLQFPRASIDFNTLCFSEISPSVPASIKNTKRSNHPSPFLLSPFPFFFLGAYTPLPSASRDLYRPQWRYLSIKTKRVVAFPNIKFFLSWRPWLLKKPEIPRTLGPSHHALANLSCFSMESYPLSLSFLRLQRPGLQPPALLPPLTSS